MQEFWKVALSVAGLGALVSFVLWSLYKNWVKLAIFQRMTKEQQFKLFKLFFCLTFVFAVWGLVAYVAIELFGPKHHAAEHSLNELIQLVQARRVNVLDLIDQQEKAFKAERQKTAEKRKPTEDIDAKLDRLNGVKKRFDRLSSDYIAALNDRQLVRSHELLRDILALLDDPQTRALFLERLAFGEKKEAVYVPTRTLTRTFFEALPKNLQGRVEAALPVPDPFGQDYPDPHWPKGSKGYPSLKSPLTPQKNINGGNSSGGP